MVWVAQAQIGIDPEPWLGDPGTQSLLSAQQAAWDHLYGEDTWSWADVVVPLDAAVSGSGEWVTGSSRVLAGSLAFYVSAYFDSELDNPSDPDIPQDVHDYVAATGYRSAFVYGEAFGPSGGAIPVYFGGYFFEFTDEKDANHFGLVITILTDEQTLDNLAAAEAEYQNLLLDFVDLGGESPGPPLIAVVDYCPGREHLDNDAAFDACIYQAAADYMCRRAKVRRRQRNQVIGAGVNTVICISTVLLIPPAGVPICAGGLALLGANQLCILNALSDNLPQYQNAKDCCCIALECRVNGGGSNCQSVAECNQSGCDVPVCGS